RPALALHWLRTHRTPPPMNLGALIAGLDVPPAVTRTIADLVRRKAAAGEGETIARSPVADSFLEAALARTVPRPLERRDPTLVERANRFLASVLASYSDAP